MDRLEQIAAFVAVARAGSFVGAARRLGRSPASVTRAVAAFEERLATRLLTRTTRVVRLSEAGQQQLAPCERLLADVAALEASAAAGQREALGTLTITASVVFGRLHVLPIVGEFLRRHASVAVRLLLDDAVVPLVERGIDVGVRIAHLPDSSLKAVRVGAVTRGVYASPAYLAAHGEPATPDDLRRHECVAVVGLGGTAERWSFGRRDVRIAPRLVVGLAEPAIDAAVAGLGVTHVLSYMVDHLVRAGTLRPILEEYASSPIPVHVVYPAGRHLPLRTRLFVDHAVEVLRGRFARTSRAR